MGKLVSINLKQAVTVFLLVLLVTGAVRQGWAALLPQVSIALGTAVALDLFLNHWLRKRPIGMSSASSAIITALLISMVLAPGQSWFVSLTASVIAIGSKHLVRFRKHHIFKPADFGLTDWVWVHI